MLEQLYTYYRGASGFALFFYGLTCVIAHPSDKSRKASGGIFLATGFLFTLSSLDSVLKINQEVSFFLILTALYLLGQSCMELSVYLFGDVRIPGQRKGLWVAGIVWSLFLWTLPLLDFLFELPTARVSIEDSRSMGLFHAIASPLSYLWPVFVSLAAFHIGKGRLRDMPISSAQVKFLLRYILYIVAILLLILIAEIIHSIIIYRIAHSLLQSSLLVWALLYSRYPGYAQDIRRSIGIEISRRRLSIGENDRLLIEERLRKLSDYEEFLCDYKLDIRLLSRKIGVPAHRLSAYFNEILGTSFPEWLNAFRIHRVCELMKQRTEDTILDIALDCGYRSKTTFNAQFNKIMQMSPSAYRKKGAIS
jgi:AraC-like DNA-binding protein